MSGPHAERPPGEVVVVTGAARGQGAAEAEALTLDGGLTACGGVTSVFDALRG
ncbi:hypothetical protein [Streptomyces pactum]|uniref:hypothetical protein n=1 Tax=Streptomyces pactum TaxID=68249 RepID=UPI000AA3968A|nr:hypothetical protein [Streptomyces pactum]